MVGTSRSGSVGAFVIGGITAVAVIVGGVLLTQTSLFGPNTPSDGAPVDIQADPSLATSSAEPATAQPVPTTEEPVSTPTQEAVAATDPDQPATSETQAPAATADNADPVASDLAPSAPSSEEVLSLSAPEVDVIRFDQDGAGVIAGRAKAGSQVSVLLDGAVIEDITVPESGEFVAFPVIEPAPRPRVVTVEARDGADTSTAEASFILAPVTAQTATTPETKAAADVAGRERVDTHVSEEATSSETPEGNATEEPLTTTVVAGLATTEQGAVSQPNDLSTQPPQQSTSAARADISGDLPAAGSETASANPIAPVADGTPSAEDTPAPKSDPQGVAILRAGPDGVELVQPAAPQPPELAHKIALDTISYSTTGDVILNGRAQPSALVRVYIDNSPIADANAAEDGRWRIRLNAVIPGIYTLRMDEIDPLEGKVLSRVETPFKRESPDVLAQPASEADNPNIDTTVRAVTVQKGDTLWAISRTRYGDGFLFVKVFDANRDNIRDPDLIYPGQIFTLPE